MRATAAAAPQSSSSRGPAPLLLRPPVCASVALSDSRASVSCTQALSASALSQQHAGTRSDGCLTQRARVAWGHSWTCVSSFGACTTAYRTSSQCPANGRGGASPPGQAAMATPCTSTGHAAHGMLRSSSLLKKPPLHEHASRPTDAALASREDPKGHFLQTWYASLKPHARHDGSLTSRKKLSWARPQHAATCVVSTGHLGMRRAIWE